MPQNKYVSLSLVTDGSITRYTEFKLVILIYTFVPL